MTTPAAKPKPPKPRKLSPLAAAILAQLQTTGRARISGNSVAQLDEVLGELHLDAALARIFGDSGGPLLISDEIPMTGQRFP